MPLKICIRCSVQADTIFIQRSNAGFNGFFSLGLSEFQSLLKRVCIVYENGGS